MSLSDLGARLFGNSKLLRSGELIGLVRQWLAIEAQRGETENSDPSLDKYCIVDNPSAVKVTLFGPILYSKRGRKFDFILKLWQCSTFFISKSQSGCKNSPREMS